MAEPVFAEPAAVDDSPYQAPAHEGATAAEQAGTVATWFYRPFDLVGIGFVYVLFFSLAMASARAAGEEAVDPDPAGLLTSIVFQFIIAGIVTFFVIARIRPVDWLGLKWPSWPWVFLIAPAAVFVMWMLIGGLQVAGFMNWIESLGVETVQDTVKLLQNSSDPLILGLMAIRRDCRRAAVRGNRLPRLSLLRREEIRRTMGGGTLFGARLRRRPRQPGRAAAIVDFRRAF